MGHPLFDLKNRTAVVIGGTSGIGLTLAKGLAEAGANVVATGRRSELVQKVTSEIRDIGVRSLALPCDVTDAADVENLLAAACKEMGGVEILVNCAGRTKRTATLELSDAEWNEILDTNLTGTLRACRIFGRHMLERKNGRIINIASLATFVSLLEVTAYSASKAGVGSLTKSLAVEWGPRGVNVNAIAPGVFPTDLNRKLIEGTPRGNELLARTPLRRFGRAEELAGAAVYLASDA